MDRDKKHVIDIPAIPKSQDPVYLAEERMPWPEDEDDTNDE